MMETAESLMKSAKSTKKKFVKKNRDSSNGESKPTTASSTTRKEPRASSSLVGKRIRVYRNGDIFFKGLKVVINTRQINSVQAFLDVINERIGLTYGAKRLYTMNGQFVKTMDEIENDKEYVAATNVFTPLNYGQVRIPFSSSEVIKTNSETPSKHSIRISRSSEPRKEKAEVYSKRTGSLAPLNKHAANNVQQNGNSATDSKKKLTKRKGTPKHGASKVEPSSKETSSSNDASIPTNPPNPPKKNKKVLKKKVKIPEEPCKSVSPDPDSSSPASTIARAHSVVEQISVHERTPTPLPVREVPDSGEENNKNDSIPSSEVGSPKEASKAHGQPKEENKRLSDQKSEEADGDPQSRNEPNRKMTEQGQHANYEREADGTKGGNVDS